MNQPTDFFFFSKILPIPKNFLLVLENLVLLLVFTSHFFDNPKRATKNRARLAWRSKPSTTASTSPRPSREREPWPFQGEEGRGRVGWRKSCVIFFRCFLGGSLVFVSFFLWCFFSFLAFGMILLFFLF